ncbi:FAD synthetase family protein [Thermotoga caldifontis]|uniref:FAD synthetase family protein n=1 Tax=Thermotoga caldifontis TaxID=1508419 RepID=UPI00069329E9|nr:FAD synthetase family protein [Thermotoga caldifontis]
MYVTTIGVFDGVHLGHRALLKRVQQIADEHGLRSRAFVVSHPFEHLKGEFDGLITSHERRILLLSQYLDEVYLLDLRKIKDMTAESFFEQFLARDTRILVVGKDFRFGRNASGDSTLLEKLCREEAIDLEVFHEVQDENHVRISSSRIRELIKEGRIEEAERLLGHDYLLEAVVLNTSKSDSKSVVELKTLEGLIRPQNGVFDAEERNLNIRGRIILDREVRLITQPVQLAPGTYVHLKLSGGKI